MHMCRLPSLFFCTKRMGAPYGLVLRQIELCSRYASICLHTSAYSVGVKQYCLGLCGWASGSSKVISSVILSERRKMGSAKTSENSFNKAKI